MDFEDEEDNLKPEKLLIYQKGKQIFDMVHKIADLIPEDKDPDDDIPFQGFDLDRDK